MSAIAAIYHRARTRVGADEVQSVLSALDHRGPDGRHVERSPFAALAHQHHWTTPEEVGERQPLVAAVSRLQLSFDGRLDNRRELLRQLSPSLAEPRQISDAELLLAAFERWGEECFERLEGPFAAVIFDPVHLRMVCARDPLGSRTLFYASAGPRLVVASEERAVVAHPAVDDTPDRSRLAWYLALRVPEDGRTFFRAVRELLPGELLVADERGLRRRQLRLPRPLTGLARLSDAECAERFGELLDRSVTARLRAVGTPCVLMSGGLDSTSIAALAARRRAVESEAPPQPISWVFDDLADCDERQLIERVGRWIGVRPVLLDGDRSWPLREPGAWAANPSTPEENPYRLLKTLAYDATARLGGRVLLTGGGGDQLWTGAAWWLADLLAAGRPLTAACELVQALARPRHRSRALGGVRRALGLPGLRRARPAGWLGDQAMALVPAAPGHAAGAPRGCERWEGMLGARQARSATIEIFHAARAGIELRHPFRDLRLVEFMLGLPAHHNYRGGRGKHLLRVAMRDLLPREVLGQGIGRGLMALYRRGVEEREATTAKALLRAADAGSRGLLAPGWLATATKRPRAPREELLLWHLLSLELWRRRHAGQVATDLRRIA